MHKEVTTTIIRVNLTTADGELGRGKSNNSRKTWSTGSMGFPAVVTVYLTYAEINETSFMDKYGTIYWYKNSHFTVLHRLHQY